MWAFRNKSSGDIYSNKLIFVFIFELCSFNSCRAEILFKGRGLGNYVKIGRGEGD